MDEKIVLDKDYQYDEELLDYLYNHPEEIINYYKLEYFPINFLIRFINRHGLSYFNKELIIPYDILLEAVKQNGHDIQYIENPSEELKLEAIKQTGHAIQYIQNPSEELKLEAVKKNGHALKWVNNPTEEIKLEAVKQEGRSIQYINNPSEELKLEAIKQNGNAIQYIENPTEDMKLNAIKQDRYSIEFIQDPSEELQLAAVEKDGYYIRYIRNPTEKVQIAAVRSSHRALKIIFDKRIIPSEAVQLAAVENYDEAYFDIMIRNIETSEEVKLAAVRRNGRAIDWFTNINDRRKFAPIALKTYGYAIRYIDNPSKQQQLLAIQNDGEAIKVIKDPSHYIQMKAVFENGLAIKHIQNPSKQVQMKAVISNPFAMHIIEQNSGQKFDMGLVIKYLDRINFSDTFYLIEERFEDEDIKRYPHTKINKVRFFYRKLLDYIDTYEGNIYGNQFYPSIFNFLVSAFYYVQEPNQYNIDFDIEYNNQIIDDYSLYSETTRNIIESVKHYADNNTESKIQVSALLESLKQTDYNNSFITEQYLSNRTYHALKRK